MTPGHMVIDRLKLLFKIFTIFFLIYFQYVKEKIHYLKSRLLVPRPHDIMKMNKKKFLIFLFKRVYLLALRH